MAVCIFFLFLRFSFHQSKWKYLNYFSGLYSQQSLSFNLTSKIINSFYFFYLIFAFYKFEYFIFKCGVYFLRFYSIIIIAILILGAVFLPLKYLFILSTVGLLFFLFYNVRVLRRLKQKWLWIFIGVLIVIQTFILGQKDSSILGVPYSEMHLLISIRMALRALTIMLAVSYFLSVVRKSSYQAFLSKIGLDSFEQVFAISQSLFPIIKESFREMLNNIRTKKNGKGFFSNPIDLAADFIAGIIRKVEQDELTEKSKELIEVKRKKIDAK